MEKRPEIHKQKVEKKKPSKGRDAEFRGNRAVQEKAKKLRAGRLRLPQKRPARGEVLQAELVCLGSLLSPGRRARLGDPLHPPAPGCVLPLPPLPQLRGLLQTNAANCTFLPCSRLNQLAEGGDECQSWHKGKHELVSLGAGYRGQKRSMHGSTFSTPTGFYSSIARTENKEYANRRKKQNFVQ